ncbi:hypothetical protein FJZ28_03005 [Candidatus Peregrinibacteria bacterium]|nr:hypothetical protein [Candidatus Peregrinibacteria bacterium]
MVHSPPNFPLVIMEQSEIQKRIEDFLKELGVPSFIVFGWKKTPAGVPGQAEFGVVSSYHQIPPNAAIKGMSWALSDFVGKTL